MTNVLKDVSSIFMHLRCLLFKVHWHHQEQFTRNGQSERWAWPPVYWELSEAFLSPSSDPPTASPHCSSVPHCISARQNIDIQGTILGHVSVMPCRAFFISIMVKYQMKIKNGTCKIKHKLKITHIFIFIMKINNLTIFVQQSKEWVT